jgi:RNA-directed DNA polymerase
MLALRIDDSTFLTLITTWLKAGILDTAGQVRYPETGTSQGEIVSPVLANAYLHLVLDLWFGRVVRPRCRGQALLCRYADDFVCAFRCRDDASGSSMYCLNGWPSSVLRWRLRKPSFCVSAAFIRA